MVVLGNRWCESGVWGEVGYLRDSLWMLQSNLGCCDYQRFPEVSHHLSPQDVEVVGWSCALGNLEVNVLRRQVVILSTNCVIGL